MTWILVLRSSLVQSNHVPYAPMRRRHTTRKMCSIHARVSWQNIGVGAHLSCAPLTLGRPKPTFRASIQSVLAPLAFHPVHLHAPCVHSPLFSVRGNSSLFGHTSEVEVPSPFFGPVPSFLFVATYYFIMTILTRSFLQRAMPVRMLHISKIMTSDAPFQRVGPIPLPKEEQQEFERLLREKQSTPFIAHDQMPCHSRLTMRMVSQKICIPTLALDQAQNLMAISILRRAR